MVGSGWSCALSGPAALDSSHRAAVQNTGTLSTGVGKATGKGPRTEEMETLARQSWVEGHFPLILGEVIGPRSWTQLTGKCMLVNLEFPDKV